MIFSRSLTALAISIVALTAHARPLRCHDQDQEIISSTRKFNVKTDSKDHVSNIDSITDLSSQTNNVASSISVTNFFSTAPQLINNFRQIVQIASDDVSATNSHSSEVEVLSADESEALLASFNDMTTVLDVTLSVLSGKAAEFRDAGLFFLGGMFLPTLKELDAAVANLAIVDGQRVGKSEIDLLKEFGPLSRTLTSTVRTFEGLAASR